MFRFYYFFDWKECLLPDMLKTEMFNMAIKTSMQYDSIWIEGTAVYTFIQVTHVHMYRLQSDTSYLPLIMKLPVVRYSPEGAVLDTWSW